MDKFVDDILNARLNTSRSQSIVLSGASGSGTILVWSNPCSSNSTTALITTNHHPCP